MTEPFDPVAGAGRPGMEEVFGFETLGLTWLTVHGLLCLALRHPGLSGSVRARGSEIRDALAELLVEKGVLTPEEAVIARALEEAR